LSQQHTIERDVEVAGRGLFTGLETRMRFRPAPADSGITFVRSDQNPPIRIPVDLDHLTKRARRSSLKNGTVSIETIEHCLSALRGCEIDNVDIELDNGEVPAGDGSAVPFVDVLRSAGRVALPQERRYFNVREPVRINEGSAELVAWPGEANRLDIIYELDYGSDNPIGRQLFRYTLDPEDYFEQIAPARTFVTHIEADQLRAAGLGTHLTYEDIVVVGPDGPIDNKFRFENECVRHKILDLIGDLMIFGRFVCGRIYARRSGHHLNHELVRKLLEQESVEAAAESLVKEPELDIHAVQRILPHRYPMLMVDRVIEIDGDRRAVGVKNVTINEPFFQGHYPRQPILPGVLIIEAMAQLGGILLSQKLEHAGKVAVLLSLDRVKFRRPVLPGDQMVLEAHAVRVKSRTGQVDCVARVGSEQVAEASIRFMLVDADPV
jgi:UDP-3-O-[3-hydroxymyristoyl] N-acetylglucosamine deacetylase/3-hydroxyacyl-[acyl-carrier-protein] dehydratase